MPAAKAFRAAARACELLQTSRLCEIAEAAVAHRLLGMRTNPKGLAQLPRVRSRWAQGGGRKAVGHKAVGLRASPISLVRSRRPDVMGRLVRHPGRRAPSDPRFCPMFSGSQRKRPPAPVPRKAVGPPASPITLIRSRRPNVMGRLVRQALYPALRALLAPTAKRQYLSRTNRWPKLRWLRY